MPAAPEVSRLPPLGGQATEMVGGEEWGWRGGGVRVYMPELTLG